MKIILDGRPISKKNHMVWIKSKFGRMPIPSKQYKNFERDALQQLMPYKKNKFTGPIHVTYQFYMKGNLSTDFDNMIAGINDILQISEIIDNDKNIKKGTFEVIQGNKNWQTVVEIESL